jgi:Ca2+-binding RTX toxin-like protein
MAISIPHGTTQFLIQDNDQTYVLQAGDLRTASGTDVTIVMDAAAHGDTLIIKGRAEQTDNATAVIEVAGDDMQVNIADTGAILGIGGVALDGAGAILFNAGSIESTGMNSATINSSSADAFISNTGTIQSSQFGTAILTSGVDSIIRNDGTVQGAVGILVNKVRTTIELGAHSHVTGTEEAITASNTETTDSVSINNHGHITGQGAALAIQLVGGSNDTVVNQGTIVGEIVLGGGQDVFDNRGGSVDHAIEGNLGDDTLITDNAAVTLTEIANQGYDTVKSTVTYTLSANVEKLVLIGTANVNGIGTDGNNDLLGNTGKNHLSGQGGADWLDGGAGDDLLTGGAGADSFIFKTGYGHDTITDFSHAERDKLDVTHWGFQDFQAVLQHSTMDHGDLVITLGQDQLILENTGKADLHASDFLFAM